jgi:hypothetical protein
MRRAHIASLAALVSAALYVCTVPAAQAEFGIANFEAGTCKTDTPECTYSAPPSQFYTQAAGHPSLGITGFEVNTASSGEPEGKVKDVRVDIPPGLSVNPNAAPQCSEAEFNSSSGCAADTQVGEVEITAFVLITKIGPVSLPIYNLTPPQGVPAEFGFRLNVAPLIDVRVLIVGGLSWYHEPVTSENSGVPTGDYHEYFTIKEVPTTLATVKTRLKFNGTAGDGTFLTLPSGCSTQTSYLHIDSYEAPGQFKSIATISGFPPKAVTVSGCDEVPFSPSLSLTPGVGEQLPDQPDGASVDLHVPQNPHGKSSPNSSDLKTAQVTLPEGMTMNPSAAHGLEGCTEAQIAVGTNNPVACPAGSQIGTVAVETPVLPAGSLVGSVYLGKPSTGAITGPPFTVYLAVESHRYGVGARLEGSVVPNPSTGQLTATFSENPQLPFEDLTLRLESGPGAPVANPLVCAAAPLSGLTPYTGQPAAGAVLSSPFTAGAGSVCATSAPFSLAQGTQSSNSTAGAYTQYTFNLSRSDGHQYVAQVKTTLPPGLLGAIPSVALCGEPQAALGSCAASSQIGTATVAAGAGAEPYAFSGPVFLTGSYNGAPYGLSIPVAAVAGPFDFGTVVTRAAITVDPRTARVTVTSSLPTIVRGVPLRLKNISVAVNRASFLFNPTNCGPLATESTLTSTFGVTQGLSSPFQVGDCGALAFKPSFKVATSARTSRANGASLRVNLAQAPHQANIRSVSVQLPKQLPSRLTTLQQACPEATFANNPRTCPSGSLVGGATVTTPVLPDKLSGPAYLVSHGGVAFPDLDLILEGDGVQVILTGNTNIKRGVTTSTFAALPDVPVSSFALSLPAGRHSALAADGNLCTSRLVMPTAITAQNGAQVKQSTKISVSGCPVLIVGHRVSGHKLVLRIRTFAAGRISVKGKSLHTIYRRLGKAATTTLKAPLSRGGLRALRRHRRLRVHVRVGFVPKQKGAPGSVAFANVAFR